MSIFEGEGCQELEVMKKETSKRNENHRECCDLVFREENIVHKLTTNTVFFFAGNCTIDSNIHVFKLVWVVLALCTHSQKRISLMSISKEAWIVSSFLGSTSFVSTFSHQKIPIFQLASENGTNEGIRKSMATALCSYYSYRIWNAMCTTTLSVNWKANSTQRKIQISNGKRRKTASQIYTTHQRKFIVTINYSLTELLWVVLAIFAHSQEGRLIIRISMELARRGAVFYTDAQSLFHWP